MSRNYVFYKSLRFRFGAVFGSLFLTALVLIALFLYVRISRQLEQTFSQYLKSSASVLLSKTELNPLTIPVPQSGEQFFLLYDNGSSTDTLFPAAIVRKTTGLTLAKRSVVLTRELETGGRFIIRYTRSSSELDQSITELRSVLFLYLPVALILSLVAGYFLSRALVKPIRRLINQANRNAVQSDISLLPVPVVEDELHALTLSLNEMLGRLQLARTQQNAFFASAAHELRTPLSLMMTGLQVERLKIDDPVALVAIDNQLQEVRRLTGLVDNLLLMSRLASGVKNNPVPGQVLSLSEVLTDNIELLEPRAGARKQTFKISFMPEEAGFTTAFQPAHLNILVRNLLDNAIVHGSQNAPIELLVKDDARQGLSLVVKNATDEPVTDLDRLTREFEKGNAFREGFGLGLWIVKELATLNSAEVKFEFQAPWFIATVLFSPP